jgi:hypothetical protein
MSTGRGKLTATKYRTFHTRYLHYLSPSFAQPTYGYNFVKIERKENYKKINTMDKHSLNKSCAF